MDSARDGYIYFWQEPPDCPLETCMKCGDDIPVTRLRSHVETCGETMESDEFSESSSENAPKV